MMRLHLSEKQILKDGVTLKKEFKTEDGMTWYLIPYKTSCWPNGTPHKVSYQTLCGCRIIIRLDETGNLIVAKYA